MRTAFLTVAALLLTACTDASADRTKAGDSADADATASLRLWTVAQRAPRRTCPSENCGVVGELMFREGTEALERRGDWVRVSRFYDAACQDGRSAYVDSGDSRCIAANGITDGRFAEWVRAEQLGGVRPADPAESAAASERVVAHSDDFNLHRKAFASAAERLIADGKCTASDFEENAGWTKSVNHRSQPVYFIWCGGTKVYLNAATGRIS